MTSADRRRGRGAAWSGATAVGARVLSRHRRAVAALCAACAVVAGVSSVQADAGGEAVLAAARDLPAGATLDGDAVTVVQLPARSVPTGALRPGSDLAGRPLAGPVRRGEPLTDVRLAGPSLLAALDDDAAGLVAAPVRVADPGVLTLLRAGDQVDVLAARADPTGGSAPSARRAATRARVLALPESGGDDLADASVLDGALVVLAVDPATAAGLAAAAVDARLSLVLRGSDA